MMIEHKIEKYLNEGNDVKQAEKFVKNLKSMSKKEVFKQYERYVLGKVHNASVKEQKKSWMIYDIIKELYNEDIADKIT